MKAQIPFTDYDFYAYLTSGLILISACTLAISQFGGALPLSLIEEFRSLHLAAQFILGGIISYTVGQVVASVSASMFEKRLVKDLLNSHPVLIIMGLDRHVPAIVRLLGGREYCQMSPVLQAIVRAKLGAGLDRSGLTSARFMLGRDDESLMAEYQLIYSEARRSSDTAARMDSSRNQYAFSRNMALVSLLCGAIYFLLGIYCLFTTKGIVTWPLSLSCLCALMTVGLTARFMKFYAIFYSQAYRGYLSLPAILENEPSLRPAPREGGLEIEEG